MRRSIPVQNLAVALVLILDLRNLSAQTSEPTPLPTATESTAEIVIPDEPLTIDPATLVPPRLAQPATVEFNDASLNDVVGWLREDQNISIVVEEKTLEEAGITLTETLTDQLTDEPLYLLLNRLHPGKIGW